MFRELIICDTMQPIVRKWRQTSGEKDKLVCSS